MIANVWETTVTLFDSQFEVTNGHGLVAQECVEASHLDVSAFVYRYFKIGFCCLFRGGVNAEEVL